MFSGTVFSIYFINFRKTTFIKKPTKFQIVEHHYPGRVIRQFGLRQTAPPPMPISEDTWRQLHFARDISPGRDWGHWHREYVQLASAAAPPIAEEHRRMDVPPV